MPDGGLRNLLEEATQRYEQSLDARVRSYLSERGIAESAALSSRLGLVVAPVVGHERFRGYLSIPFVTPAGVVGMKFRCLSQHDCGDLRHGKYDKVAGQRSRMYNTPALIAAAGVVGIAEGELDAIVATTVVGVPTVGISGVSSWKPHYSRMFAGIERIIVWADNDVTKIRPECNTKRCKDNGACLGHNPGREFGDRLAAELERAVVVSPPVEGLDITDWVLGDGPEAIRAKAGL